MRLQPGTLFADKYEIEALLGEGGMGTVYVARNLALDKRVALKVLGSSVKDTKGAAERFVREGVSASQVRHPAVVEVYDAGVFRDVPWMAMELLEGETLRERLERRYTLPVGEVAAIAEGMLAGLAAVHERGIVHRDLKPDNIFLEQQRQAVQVKILDFGIAKNQASVTNLTSTGAAIGTALYLAPEQATDASNVDQRCDLYALGVVMYEALSGRPPFVADTLTQLVAKLLTEEPPPLTQAAPRVSAEMSRAVHWCLEREPVRRPQSALALLELLQTLNVTKTVASVPAKTVPVESARPFPRGGVPIAATEVRTPDGHGWASGNSSRDAVADSGGGQTVSWTNLALLLCGAVVAAGGVAWWALSSGTLSASTTPELAQPAPGQLQEPARPLDNEAASARTPEQQLRDHLNAIGPCVAASKRAAESENRYRSWVDWQRGPSRRTRLASHGVYAITRTAVERCANVLESMVASRAGDQELVGLSEALPTSLLTLREPLELAKRYYDDDGYEDDGFRLGQELHPRLVRGFETQAPLTGRLLAWVEAREIEADQLLLERLRANPARDELVQLELVRIATEPLAGLRTLGMVSRPEQLDEVFLKRLADSAGELEKAVTRFEAAAIGESHHTFVYAARSVARVAQELSRDLPTGRNVRRNRAIAFTNGFIELHNSLERFRRDYLERVDETENRDLLGERFTLL